MLAETEYDVGTSTTAGTGRSLLTTRELGVQFGVGRAVVADRLAEAGLCTAAGTPTKAAVRDGCCRILPAGLTLWRPDRVLPALRAMAAAAQKEDSRLALSRAVEAARLVLEWNEILEVVITTKAKELGMEARLL